MRALWVSEELSRGTCDHVLLTIVCQHMDCRALVIACACMRMHWASQVYKYKCTASNLALLNSHRGLHAKQQRDPHTESLQLLRTSTKKHR